MSLCGFHLGWHSDACPFLSEYVEGLAWVSLLSCLFGCPGWRTPLLSGWFWPFPPPPGRCCCVLCSPLLTCLPWGCFSGWGHGQAEWPAGDCAFRRLEGHCPYVLLDSGLYMA